MKTLHSILAAKFKIDLKSLSVLSQQTRKAEHTIFVLRRPSIVSERLIELLTKQHQIELPAKVSLDELLEAPTADSYSFLHLRKRSGSEFTVTQSKRYRAQLYSKLEKLRANSTLRCTRFVPVSLFAGLGPRPWPAPTTLAIDWPWLPLADAWLYCCYTAHAKELHAVFGPEYRAPDDAQPGEIIHSLSRSLYQNEKQHRGAPAKQTGTVEQIVISSEEVQRVIDEVCVTSSLPRGQVLAEASQDFREIAARVNARLLSFVKTIMKPVIERLFERIEVYGLERVRQELSSAPVILIPAHRSHFDYLILPYVLYFGQLPMPYVAAGNNLNFFPIGRLLRAGGAFFIRRKVDKDLVYKAVLSRYLTHLVKQGHLIKFYIEGGRSRIGFTLAPRMGLLKMVLRLLQHRARADITLVPVGLSYERLPEASAFSREQRGEQKKSESFFELLKAGRILKQSFGTVTVHFGKSISLKQFTTDSEHSEKFANNRLSEITQELALRVTRDINHYTPLTSTTVLSTALASTLHYGGNQQTLLTITQTILKVISLISEPEEALEEISFDSFIRKTGTAHRLGSIAISGSLRELLTDESTDDVMRPLLTAMEELGLVEISEQQNDTWYQNPAKERLKLEMYKNAALHLLVTPAIIAIASGESKNCVNALYVSFRKLCFFPSWDDWLTQVKRLEQELSSQGRDNLAPLTLLLLPFLEAVTATASAILKSDSSKLSKTELNQLINLELGSTSYTRAEAISLTLHDYALSVLEELELLQVSSRYVTVTPDSDKPSDRIFEGLADAANCYRSITKAVYSGFKRSSKKTDSSNRACG